MSAPLNILHIQGSFDLGGKEARTARLMNIWDGRARHSLLIGNPAMRGACAAIDAEVDAQVVEDGPSIMGAPSYARLSAIARYMRRFDLILTYNWGAMNAVMAHRLFGRAMRLPALIHHEDGFNADEAARLSPKRNLFRRIALGRAQGLVVPSCQLERIAVCAWGQPTRRVHNIPNGIDAAAYARRPFPDAIPGLHTSADRVVVGTLAGLRAVKNLSRLVRIAAPLADRITLVIVGEGPERERIAAEARTLGLDSLVMPGFMARPQDFIGLFDIFALTSDSEQFPISLVEAMAAGLPVLSTDVGDVNQMLSPGNRPYLFAPDDEAGLARGLAELVADPVLRARLGAANQQRAMDAFDERGMVARYAALYGAAAGSVALSR
ncbi:glycosyltransferase family 4 protein [Sphingobium sufflavum]|uniref:glycosyltransferase family 4 protein n=1 Tax=Sphingobium sufflavum TaxID=1129547 RepID=UPI001F308217|nr:glycosyltransferase family 4 protein [Sphingobium sufflavum]MCE7796071.1 glycosyltransferase family 4 protein [Sphingobium sufflavum]